MNEVLITTSRIIFPGRLNLLKHFALRALKKMKLDNWEVSVLLCDDRLIRDLNLRYRGINRPTDVLTFSQGQSPGTGAGGGQKDPAGDIVISMDTLNRNAKLNGVDTEKELRRLLIHGLLHLNGINHDETDSTDEMIALQEQMLNELNSERII